MTGARAKTRCPRRGDARRDEGTEDSVTKGDTRTGLLSLTAPVPGPVLGPRHTPPTPLALPIGTRPLDHDADQCTAVGQHHPPVVVPIRMFPREAAIIVHERFHCLWTRHD